MLGYLGYFRHRFSKTSLRGAIREKLPNPAWKSNLSNPLCLHRKGGRLRMMEVTSSEAQAT